MVITCGISSVQSHFIGQDVQVMYLNRYVKFSQYHRRRRRSSHRRFNASDGRPIKIIYILDHEIWDNFLNHLI